MKYSHHKLSRRVIPLFTALRHKNSVPIDLTDGAPTLTRRAPLFQDRKREHDDGVTGHRGLGVATSAVNFPLAEPERDDRRQLRCPSAVHGLTHSGFRGDSNTFGKPLRQAWNGYARRIVQPVIREWILARGHRRQRDHENGGTMQ
jgi:hypothetical protein